MALSSSESAEVKLIKDVVAGSPADFGSDTSATSASGKPEISGELLRCLLLSLPLPKNLEIPKKLRKALDRRDVPYAPSGVRVRGAVIRGLNLADARGADGNECPALVLEDCELTAAPGSGSDALSLDARHAKLARLALSNCKVEVIDLSGAEILGDLELRKLHGSDGGLCWVKACDIRVEGNVTGDGAQLVSPREKSPHNARCDYALDLYGASISGNLDLLDGFSADGGVCLTNSSLTGDIWAIDANFKACQEYSLKLQGARIGGAVVLRAGHSGRFHAVGELSFLQASLGTLDLTGASLQQSSNTTDGSVLHADMANIQGNLVLNDLDAADGDVYLRQAKISGDLFASPVRIRSMYADNLSVGGSVYLYGTLGGNADFRGAHIARELQLGKLTAADGDIGLGPDEGIALEADGDIDLKQTAISGNLIASPVRIRSMHADSLNVGGSVYLRGILRGNADFHGAQITGDMCVGNAKRQKDASKIPKEDRSARRKAQEKFSLNCLHRERSVNEYRVSIEDASIGRDLRIIGLRLAYESVPLPAEEPPVLVRERSLRCYPGWRLGEALFQRSGENYFLLGYLVAEPGADQSSPFVLLTGESSPIHALNERKALDLSTPDQVREYLRLFCAYVWGDDGAFSIIERVEDFADPSPVIEAATRAAIQEVEIERREQDVWNAKACVNYGAALFKADFEIKTSGEITMLDDDPVGEVPLPEWRSFEIPVQNIRRQLDSVKGDLGLPAWPVPPPLPESWEGDQQEGHIQSLRSAVKSRHNPLVGQDAENQTDRLKMNLKGAKVTALDDGGGVRWGSDEQLDGGGVRWGSDVLLDLDGFSYERLDDTTVGGADASGDFLKATADISTRNSKEMIDKRIVWLKLQYPGREFKLNDEFTPQPYEQLARCMRRAGHAHSANMILIERLTIERRLHEQDARKELLEDRSALVADWSGLIEQLKASKFRKLGSIARIFFSKSNPVMLLFKWIFRWLESRLLRLYEATFQYGLSARHACATFGICLIIGVISVDIANYGYVRIVPVGSDTSPPPTWLVPEFLHFPLLKNPVLVVDTMPVSTLVASNDNVSGSVDKLASPRVTDIGATVDEIPCRDQIESIWYALDVFVPLLDLLQEPKCTITSRADAWGWRLMKSVYAVLGALITALTILTVSGILRRHVERNI